MGREDLIGNNYRGALKLSVIVCLLGKRVFLLLLLLNNNIIIKKFKLHTLLSLSYLSEAHKVK